MKKFIFLFLFCFVPAALALETEQLVDRVLAVVNKEVITQSEFDAIFRPLYEEMKQAGVSENKEEMREMRLKLLNQMIEDRLVAQEAKKLGIEVTDAEVKEELDNLKKDFPDEKTFYDTMKAEGIGMSDIDKRLRERVAIEKLHEYVIRGKTVVPPAEIEQYFKDHPDEFVQKERIKASVITIRKTADSVAKGLMDEASRAEARRIRDELKNGGNFEELARKYSQDTYAAQGGAMGEIEKGTILGSIEEVLFALSPGQMSDVLETEQAYHIFRVEDRAAGRTYNFEEARDLIQSFLFRKKAHERFVEWMDELKKKSYISIR